MRGRWPIRVSSFFRRRFPIRVSFVLRIRPVLSRYQNRSRPRIRWGSGFCAVPIEMWVSCERRQLFGDLIAGVATTDDEHPAVADVPRRAVRGAVHLGHLRPEPLGDRRDERRLEWPGCDHHLVGFDGAIVELDEVRRIRCPHGLNPTAELERQRRSAWRSRSGSRRPRPWSDSGRGRRETASPAGSRSGRGEQLQRIPALTPRGRRLGGRLQNREVEALLCEVSSRSRGQPGHHPRRPRHGSLSPSYCSCNRSFCATCTNPE